MHTGVQPLNKMGSIPKMSTFLKSQTLTPGSSTALWPARMHNTSFDRSCFCKAYLLQKMRYSTFGVIYVSSKLPKFAS